MAQQFWDWLHAKDWHSPLNQFRIDWLGLRIANQRERPHSPNDWPYDESKSPSLSNREYVERFLERECGQHAREMISIFRYEWAQWAKECRAVAQTFRQWIEQFETEGDSRRGFYARHWRAITPGRISSAAGVDAALARHLRELADAGAENPSHENHQAWRSAGLAIDIHPEMVKAYDEREDRPRPKTKDQGATVTPFPGSQVPQGALNEGDTVHAHAQGVLHGPVTVYGPDGGVQVLQPGETYGAAPQPQPHWIDPSTMTAPVAGQGSGPNGLLTPVDYYQAQPGWHMTENSGLSSGPLTSAAPPPVALVTAHEEPKEIPVGTQYTLFGSDLEKPAGNPPGFSGGYWYERFNRLETRLGRIEGLLRDLVAAQIGGEVAEVAKDIEDLRRNAFAQHFPIDWARLYAMADHSATE